MLGIFPCFDASSRSFDEFSCDAYHQISKAGAKHALFFIIGDPARSDAQYSELRSAEQEKRDKKASTEFKEDHRTSRSEANLRMEQALICLDLFNVNTVNLPGFLFVKGQERVGYLPIPRAWFETETSRTVFIDVFCSWLGSDEAVKVASVDLNHHDIGTRLGEMLDNLTDSMTHRLETLSQRGGINPAKNTQLSDSSRRRSTLIHKKRGPRAITMDALQRALIQHIRAAQDKLWADHALGRPLELLPRPTKQQLAAEIGVHKSSVTRAFNDENAYLLRSLWNLAADLGRVMDYGRR